MQLYAHVQLKLPPIWKLAVSPEGKYIAFVLRNREKRGNGSLYICRMDQLPTTRSSFADSSSSRPSTSTDATLSHNTRPIPLPVPAEAICELKFSKLIALYAVVKPEQNTETLKPTITVLAWSMKDGRPKAHRPCEVEHDGKDDLIHSLFTSFSPYNQELAYTLISQEKRIVSYSWGLHRFTENKAWGYRLVEIIANENDTKFFCFGTREANNNLRLLSFSTTPSGDKLKMSKIAKLPNMTPQSKFSARLFEPNLPDAASQRKILVADMKGQTVRILQFPLTP